MFGGPDMVDDENGYWESDEGGLAVNKGCWWIILILLMMMCGGIALVNDDNNGTSNSYQQTSVFQKKWSWSCMCYEWTDQ